MFCLLWSLWLWSELLARSCQSPLHTQARMGGLCECALKIRHENKRLKKQRGRGRSLMLPVSFLRYSSFTYSPSTCLLLLCLSSWPTSIHPPVVSLPHALFSFLCFEFFKNLSVQLTACHHSFVLSSLQSLLPFFMSWPMWISPSSIILSCLKPCVLQYIK